jgi:hypothetical protein
MKPYDKPLPLGSESPSNGEWPTQHGDSTVASDKSMALKDVKAFNSFSRKIQRERRIYAPIDRRSDIVWQVRTLRSCSTLAHENFYLGR